MFDYLHTMDIGYCSEGYWLEWLYVRVFKSSPELDSVRSQGKE